MMKVEYTCDECGLIIDGVITPEKGPFFMAGSGQLCELTYNGIIGHNGFYNSKYFHYFCFCKVVDRINKK